MRRRAVRQDRTGQACIGAPASCDERPGLQRLNAGQLAVFVGGIAGDLPKDFELGGHGGVGTAGVHEQHGPFLAEGIDVQLKAAAVVDEAVFGLSDAVQRAVALHQVAYVGLFGDGLLGIPLGAVGHEVLLRIEIEVILAVLLLADAALDGGVGHGQVGLHHLQGQGVVAAAQRGHVRHLDQELALLDHGLRLAEYAVDFPKRPVDLFLEIHGVVDDAQVGVAAPGPEGAVVHLPGVLQRLRPGGVAQVVGELCALGAGDQVDHGVVARENAGLRAAVEAGDDLVELLVGDVGLVVHQRPVVDDEDVVLGHHLRGLQRQVLLVDLVRDDEVLEGEHAHAAAEGPDTEVGNQLGGRLRNGDDPPAVLLLKLVQDPADQRGLARGRAARQHDLRDFLGHTRYPPF